MSANKPGSSIASPEAFDTDDAPELGDEFFDNAEVRVGDEVVRTAGEGKRRGRPPAGDTAKVQQSLRLPADVVEAFRASGAGWQRRMGDVLAVAAQVDSDSVAAKVSTIQQVLAPYGGDPARFAEAIAQQAHDAQLKIQALGGMEAIRSRTDAAAEAFAKINAVGGIDAMAKAAEQAQRGFEAFQKAGGFETLRRIQEAAAAE